VGLERGPLSLVSTTEELLERKSSGSSGLENREYGSRDPSRCARGTIYPPLRTTVYTDFVHRRKLIARRKTVSETEQRVSHSGNVAYTTVQLPLSLSLSLSHPHYPLELLVNYRLSFAIPLFRLLG
jgi:hypothetical protein